MRIRAYYLHLARCKSQRAYHKNKQMKLLFWSIGKAHDSYVTEGIGMFTKRISNYFPVEWQLLPPARLPATATPKAYKDKEGQQVLDALKPGDYLVLLDEKGKMLSSESFAAFIQARANDSTKQVVFLIGGAFGVS